MSSVVDSVEASFKNLIATKPYRSVAVKDICEGAYISRRTFYANFADKRALVDYLLDRDAIEPVRQVIERLSLEEALPLAPALVGRFYQGIYDNRDYYASLVKPMFKIDTTFAQVVLRATSKMISQSILCYNPYIDEGRLNIAAQYHGAAQAFTLEEWIFCNYEMPLEELAATQSSLITSSLCPLVMEGR